MKKQKTSLNTWQKLAKVGKWFRGFSSLAGISQYRISDNRISKTCWISLYWLGVACTSFLVYQSFERFVSHPYVTKMERKNAYSSRFPSVTICNPNRVHCKHLYSRIKECQTVWSLSALWKTKSYHTSVQLVNYLLRYREKIHVPELESFVVYSWLPNAEYPFKWRKGLQNLQLNRIGTSFAEI